MKKVNSRQRVYLVVAGINTTPNFNLFAEATLNTVDFLRQLMQENIVTFVFRNKNDTICTRRGTLHPKFIQYYFMRHPDHSRSSVRADVLRFWDPDKAGDDKRADKWSTAVADRLIGYYTPVVKVEDDEEE